MEKDGGERKDPWVDIEKSIARLFREAAAAFGTTHPDDLPLDDSAVGAMYIAYDSWIRVLTAQAERIGTPEAHLEMSLRVTPFLVDAGFTDPEYIEEVANDFLAQDLAQAEELGLGDLAERIRAKREELLRLI